MSDGNGKTSIMASQENAANAWQSVQMCSVILDQFDWPEVSRVMNRAHSVGHIIDPTGYRDLLRNKTVEDNVKIAKAVDTFLTTLRQIKAEAEDRK